MNHIETINYTEDKFNMALTATVALTHLKGNSHPHFSVTGNLTENHRWASGGCLHELILSKFPHLSDAISLHLSDDSGIPMYALENGFYYCKNPKEYGDSVIADHFRISINEVPSIRAMGYVRLGAWIELEKPRWKAEADAVIAKYSLTIDYV